MGAGEGGRRGARAPERQGRPAGEAWDAEPRAGLLQLVQLHQRLHLLLELEAVVARHERPAPRETSPVPGVWPGLGPSRGKGRWAAKTLPLPMIPGGPVGRPG